MAGAGKAVAKDETAGAVAGALVTLRLLACVDAGRAEDERGGAVVLGTDETTELASVDETVEVVVETTEMPKEPEGALEADEANVKGGTGAFDGVMGLEDGPRDGN